jgi:DNA-binding XRE family transcriptional regulator
MMMMYQRYVIISCKVLQTLNNCLKSLMKPTESTVNERIKILLETRANGNKSALAKKIGVSSQTIGDIVEGRKGNPSFLVIQGLISAFPEVNAGWLISGNGEMLIGQQPEAASLTSAEATLERATELASVPLLREIIDTQKETITDLRGMVATLKEELGKFGGSSDAALHGIFPTAPAGQRVAVPV